MTELSAWDRMARRYAQWVIRWRWAAIGVSVLLFLGAAAGLRNGLAISDNYRIFFDQDNPHLKALDQLDATYAKEEVILFVLAPKDGNVFTRGTLGAIEELTKAAWQIAYCQRVNSITNFQHTRAEGDDIIVEDLVEGAADLSDENLARVRETAVNEPLLQSRLISAKGHVTAVAATLVLPGLKGGERAAPIGDARTIVSEFEKNHPDIRVVITGGAVLSQMFSDYTNKDMATLTPLMYLVIFVLLGVSFRSISATVGASLVVIMSVASGMGLTAWCGLNFSAVASAMPTVVMTLAVADSVHVIATMLAFMREGKAKREALAEALTVNVGPMIVTFATTLMGFLSMNFSTVPPLRDFGNMTAMGLTAAFIYSLLFLPGFIAVAPLRARQRPANSASAVKSTGDWVIRHRRLMLWGPLAVLIVLGAGIPLNEFKNNWVRWFKESTPFRQDLTFVTQNLSGINALEFSVPANGPSGISDPEYLKALDEFAAWYRAQPHVDHVSTITDVFRRLNMNMHGDDPKSYTIPEGRELAAQYLLLYEMSLPFGMDLNNQVNVDKSATRVQVITEDVDSDVMNAMARAGEAWLRDNAPAYMQSHATGNGVMFASIATDTMKSMAYSTPAALAFVSLTLIVLFRSVRYGLLSLLPNVAPILCAFGVWGYLVGEINFGLACVAAQTMGILVDDTIHFMSKYIRGRRLYGYDAEEAVRYAYNSVGQAVWVTTWVLVIGFLVLSLSSFRFNSYMGQLGAITIVLALAGDAFLLPAILLTFDRGRGQTSAKNAAEVSRDLA